MDIVIHYELVEREMNIYLLLKCELERRGYSVKIVNNYWVGYWQTFFLRPKLIITSACRDDDGVDWATPLFGWKGKMLNFQFEQVIGNDPKYLEMDRPKGKAERAYHICWGDVAYNRMLKGGIEESHLLPLGAIQFDFLKHNLKKLYYGKQEVADKYGLNYEKKWILFNSSFALTSDTEEEVAQKGKHFGNVIYKCLEEEKNNLQTILRIFRKLLEQTDEYAIIYRPHPSEYHMIPQVKEMCDIFQDFYYIKEESVQQWCIVADLVTVWNSTTALEANYAGKDVIALGSLKGMAEVGWHAEILNSKTMIQDYELFKQVLDDNALRKKYSALDKMVVQDFYGFTTDEYVYPKICSAIEKIIKDGENIEAKHKSAFCKKIRKIYFKKTLMGDIILNFMPTNCAKIIGLFSSHKAKTFLRLKKELSRFDKKAINKRERIIRSLLEEEKFS